MNHKEFPLRWRLSQRSLASLLGYYILVGDPYKPPFPTATGWGCLPIDALTVAYTVLLPTSSHIFICLDHTWTSYGTRILSCPLAFSSMYDLRVALWRPAIPSQFLWKPCDKESNTGSHQQATQDRGQDAVREHTALFWAWRKILYGKSLAGWRPKKISDPEIAVQIEFAPVTRITGLRAGGKCTYVLSDIHTISNIYNIKDMFEYIHVSTR